MSEQIEWLMLRRVRASRIARAGEQFVDHGQPVALVPGDHLTALLAEGMVSAAEPSSTDGLSRLSLTGKGEERYSQLCRLQRAQLPVPPAQFSTQTPAGRRLSAPRSTAPGGRPDPA